MTMKISTNMLIFLFLGFFITIAILGYHKSGRLGTTEQASAAPTGKATSLAHPYYGRTNLYRWG